MPPIVAPGLMTMLARGSHEQGEPINLEDWLCRMFIADDAVPCPAASLTLLADGGNPGSDVWYRVDPVHLRIQRDELVLADNETLAITAEEATSLTDSLNSHFREDGLVFQAVRPNRWYMKLEQPWELQTHSLPSVTGRNINSFLPHGPDGLRWHQIANEIQMLLHDHPVNEARETTDEIAINSVWLWGEGSLPKKFHSPYGSMWSDMPLVHGLAMASNTPWAALPDNGNAWLGEISSEGTHLLTLEQLRGASQYGDYYGWQDALTKLDEKWFSPLLAGLRQGSISQLVIHVTDCKRYHCFKIARSDLWKFWRQAKSIYQFN